MKRKQPTAAELNAKIDELATEILRRLRSDQPLNLEALGLADLSRPLAPPSKAKRRSTGAAGAAR